MKSRLIARAGLVALGVLSCASLAYALGYFQTWPLLGQGSYCASTIGGPLAQSQPTGTGGGNGTCAQTVPAGPAVFTGSEVVPTDVNTPGQGFPVANQAQSSALISVVQLDQGPAIDLTTVATTQTSPNNTPYYFLDGAQASALTVTMPANAIEGQLQHVTCEAATVGVLTVAANTTVVTQVIKNSPGVACTAGVGYEWRYQASNLTWYRVF
jgi:hypothetical protein